jgi:hypothetical protein
MTDSSSDQTACFPLLCFLALQTSSSRRLGQQALQRDRVAAFFAGPVCIILNVLQGVYDLPRFSEVSTFISRGYCQPLQAVRFLLPVRDFDAD